MPNPQFCHTSNRQDLQACQSEPITTGITDTLHNLSSLALNIVLMLLILFEFLYSVSSSLFLTNHIVTWSIPRFFSCTALGGWRGVITCTSGRFREVFIFGIFCHRVCGVKVRPQGLTIFQTMICCSHLTKAPSYVLSSMPNYKPGDGSKQMKAVL